MHPQSFMSPWITSKRRREIRSLRAGNLNDPRAREIRQDAGFDRLEACSTRRGKLHGGVCRGNAK